MSATIQVKFNHIPNLTDSMRANAIEAVAKAAFDIEAHAKTLVPVDTGTLKNSIQRTIDDGGLAATIPAGDGSTPPGSTTASAEYGLYVEYGTKYSRAQPFMRPAAEKVRPAFIEVMRRVAAMK